MREVFIHQDSAKVGLYKSILDAAEIPNFVRNGLTNNSVTDMPSPVFFPALCVLNDEDYERALDLLRKVHKPEPNDAPDWKCEACGEESPGSFDVCWKCGADQGAKTAPAATSIEGKNPAVTVAREISADRKVADVFRLLLIVSFLWAVTGAYILPALEIDLTIKPPPGVETFFSAHGASEQMRNVTYVVYVAGDAVLMLGYVLSFCLSRYGRHCFVAYLVLQTLQWFGTTQAIFPLAFYAVTFLDRTLFGALLAMMFLPPLNRFFGKDNA
jgi:hypothetical protein